MIMLVGNKIDIQKNRQVTYEEAYSFAKENNLKFTETCAFEDKLIEQVYISF